MYLHVTDEKYWPILKKKIKDLNIFNSDNYSDTFLIRRIECRLRAKKLDSYAQYAKLLEDDPEEKKKLLKELTIHVTHFFRDESVYTVIKNRVIPEIIRIKKQKNQKTIKIWSAGCSTGEEPYSIAMLFKEHLGENPDNFRVYIIATDIDNKSIEKAKKGIYPEQQFKETNKYYVTKYFTKMDNQYQISDEIRHMVDFRVGDILSPFNPKNVDIIFCRNTVIYFDQETKSKLYDDLYYALNNESFLVMGKTETLIGISQGKFQMFDNREKIYCKE